MVELEQELVDLAAAIQWPRGDAVAVVGERLRSGHVAVAGNARPRGWRVAVAVAAAVAAAMLVVPASRAAIGRWLGVRGDRIESSSVAAPSTVTTTPGTVVPSELDLGPEVALGDVRAQVGFTMPVPQTPGFQHPDEVHVTHPPAVGEATLVYRPRADLPAAGTTDIGMLITAFRADLEPGFFSKTVGPDTTVEPVQVQGGTGYWIEGAPHEFFYRDASGHIVPESLRLAANVLVWEVNGITVRIESALSRDDVVRVADAMA